MSSNNTTNQASYDATVHENPKDEKRWRSVASISGSAECSQIMFRVFLKVAQVVVQSRVNVSHMLSGHEKTSNWVRAVGCGLLLCCVMIPPDGDVSLTSS